jgi:hypothetical protein
MRFGAEIFRVSDYGALDSPAGSGRGLCHGQELVIVVTVGDSVT